MHGTFPRQLYQPRAKMETVFSVIEQKLSPKASGRSLPPEIRQPWWRGLAFNLYRLSRRRAPVGGKLSHFMFFRIRVYKKRGGGNTGRRPNVSIPARPVETTERRQIAWPWRALHYDMLGIYEAAATGTPMELPETFGCSRL
jgi:hypothetical protein